MLAEPLRSNSGRSMRAVRDNPAPRPRVETSHREGERKGRPSLDARSLAQPCYLPEEQHRPQGKEKVEEEDRMESVHSMHAVRDNPLTFHVRAPAA